MSAGQQRATFLFQLPPAVLWEFCRVMDGLSDLDWTRFASEVLGDQTAVRLAERTKRRTDWVMNQWEARNGRVGELIDLLERLELLRPRDVILGCASSLKPSPPPKATPTLSTVTLSSTGNTHTGGRRPLPRPDPPPLPRPDPPPQNLKSDFHQPAPHPPVVSSSSGVMCWSYKEVYAGTMGFSPSLQVGEGGFGVVYRASLRNTDCAVKRLKQDCLLDWTLLKESFQTEVDKLSKFRHPNIVDLLGFSEGPESVCLIYSYMELRSLEDQLHNECVSLSWPQRVGVVKGASTALQFLHFPPGGHAALIHGDVKSSNILLDRHLVAKLGDFGLARFACRGSAGRPAAQTASVGKTATVRGTLAYLPVEYVRDGELGTAVDVYSFGVVLMEVLTGRRALQKDRKTGETYLKDLVEEVEDSLTGSPAEAWRRQLDHRLVSGGAEEPAGCMALVALACRCLNKKRKKRPAMTEVFDKLQDIHVTASNTRSSSPLHDPPHPPLHPRPLDSSMGALSNQLSKLGPLEDTSRLSQCSRLSSSCSLTPPHALHSSSSSSFTGPCETDESRGFSQYDIRSQFSSNGSRSLFPSPRDQHHSPTGSTESQLSQPSVPTEDQYPPLTGPLPGPDTEGRTTARLYGVPECISPGGSLLSSSPETSGIVNPIPQKDLPGEARIQTADDLYGGERPERRPEESDELDYN
ncbi:interleukin-1 receptor-associated kinase 1 isoform X2 [Pseudoliparis swirei]|uniref:interleukin-1 receptor-associated kinase 1 isoform X2 n=1 Tax=Pseudoliparis swirei TaxID=2059687 RepID=UPI0024BEC247|nr:interleukin-1 receptor-associated kinase 1 isoform X2 [Pseudoliparis swirei]